MLTYYKHVEAKTAGTKLMWLYSYLHISTQIFCALLISFVLGGLLQSICFRMFCSKQSINFEGTYLLSCWFHCGDIGILHQT